MTSTLLVAAEALAAPGSAAWAGTRKLMPARSVAHDRGQQWLLRRILFLARALVPDELFISFFPFSQPG
jgi:hypothetical protein